VSRAAAKFQTAGNPESPYLFFISRLFSKALLPSEYEVLPEVAVTLFFREAD
jgi:hypothetical protein